MSYRLSKITTKSGDDGKTNLGTGDRLPKYHPKITALGNLDELNSSIGVVIAHLKDDADIKKILLQIQQHLFNFGSELCPPYKEVITETEIAFLESNIKNFNASLPPLKEFILPGGSKAAAFCHLARTTTRRAERSLVKLHTIENVNKELFCYINRLSDLLFVCSRILNKRAKINEEIWNYI